MFTSEHECLEVLSPATADDVVICMKSALDTAGYGAEASVDLVQCYTEAIAKPTDCYTQNAEQCSASACSSGVAPVDSCRGTLSAEQAEALSYCADR